MCICTAGKRTRFLWPFKDFLSGDVAEAGNPLPEPEKVQKKAVQEQEV